jgi:small subunit ribosomal protein S14
MAKTSSIETNDRRLRLIQKYAKKRKELKAKILNPKTSDEEFFAAQRELALLPRNSSPVRYRNRCSVTGRSRGYYRKFGVSRIVLREFALKGLLPGVVKASW